MVVTALNGKLIDGDNLRPELADPAFLTGDGIFETIAARQGKPVALTRHLRRLSRSAAALGYPLPPSEEIRDLIAACLEKNAMDQARLRLTVTAQTLLLQVLPHPGHPDLARVVTVPFRRNEHGALAGHKSLSYGENLVALRLARSRGADEAIFLNTAGAICEGATTNLFVAVDGRIVTPPLSSGCLPGVTREILLEKGREEGLPVGEADIHPGDIGRIEGAFLTSSLRGVQPVRVWDDRELDHSSSGCRDLVDAYREWIRREMD